MFKFWCFKLKSFSGFSYSWLPFFPHIFFIVLHSLNILKWCLNLTTQQMNTTNVMSILYAILTCTHKHTHTGTHTPSQAYEHTHTQTHTDFSSFRLFEMLFPQIMNVINLYTFLQQYWKKYYEAFQNWIFLINN